MNNLAKRIKTLLPSQAMVLDTKAKALKNKGISIVNLTAGEPDFNTPQPIINSAIQALNSGFTKYTSPQGIEELRKEIADKFSKENNIIYDPSQIIIGAGSKQLLYTAFQVMCDKNDEVIIPIPAYNTFVEQTKLAGGKPRLIKLNPPFKLKAEDVIKHVNKKTKIIVLNSPSNPTGAIIDKSELKKIADLAVKNNLWVISDEIYEKLVYSGEHISIASLNEKIKEKTLTVCGVSKTYAMTGWRLGYAAGPKNLIEIMTLLQGQMISSVNSISQMAALTAIKSDQKEIENMQKEFNKRRDFLVKEFKKIPELSFTAPEGAFYLFVSIKKLLGKKYKTSTDWRAALLEKEKIATVPGEAFYYPGFFRLSFAASMEDLQKAVTGIKNFIYET